MRNLFPYNAIMRCKLSNSFIRLSLRTFPPITYNVSAYLMFAVAPACRQAGSGGKYGWRLLYKSRNQICRVI